MSCNNNYIEFTIYFRQLLKLLAQAHLRYIIYDCAYISVSYTNVRIQSDPEPLLLSVLDMIALGLESNDSVISTAEKSIGLFVQCKLNTTIFVYHCSFEGEGSVTWQWSSTGNTG